MRRMPHDSREYERYDWNSLIGVRAGAPRGHAGAHGRLVGVPVTAGDGAGRCGTFAERTGVRVRYGTPLGGHVAATASASCCTRRTATTAAKAPDLRGRRRPSRRLPETPGIELAAHYADTRPAETYAGKRLFIIGKQNSGFELASGLLQWASPIVLASPRPAQLSVNLHSLDGVRARYIQPWEDAQARRRRVHPQRLHRAARAQPGGITVHTRRSDNGEPFPVEVDEVIAATGFRSPLQDLAALGVTRLRAQRLPAMTNDYESADRAGHLLRGHDHAGRRPGSRSTASRPTPAPSTGTATTTA